MKTAHSLITLGETAKKATSATAGATSAKRMALLPCRAIDTLAATTQGTTRPAAEAFTPKESPAIAAAPSSHLGDSAAARTHARRVSEIPRQSVVSVTPK